MQVYVEITELIERSCTGVPPTPNSRAEYSPFFGNVGKFTVQKTRSVKVGKRQYKAIN